MRRPHPRFDARRNAWVTRVGGKLKTLCPGPENSDTQTKAWNEFYKYMANLGRPVENIPPITLGELADEYGTWMKLEVQAGRMKSATLNYYQYHLQKFLNAMGGNRVATAILPLELEKYKSNWHSVQTVQRLYNWGVKMKLISENPFKEIPAPPLGERERILTPDEQKTLLDAADLPFRRFLLAMIHTIARPQEVRAFQWKHLTLDPIPMFVLKDYKAKKLRKKKSQRDTRKFPLDAFMVGLLAEIQLEQEAPKSDDFVFLNGRGKPWTTNAVRCRKRRLRKKVGLGPDENGENIVAYTMRHTGGTRATINGVPSKVLAELMGHTRTSTTERYQHPQIDHLYDAIQKANGKP